MRQHRKKGKQSKKQSSVNKQTRANHPVIQLNPVTSFIRTSLPAGILFGLSAGSVAAEGVLPNFNSSNSTGSYTDSTHNHFNIDSPTANGFGTADSISIGANQSVTIGQAVNAHYTLKSMNTNVLPEQILGSLNSAGSVTLFAQNGIVIGSGAMINVNSLIATSLKPSDNEGIQTGNHIFVNPGNEAGGMVVNRGVINAAVGGSVSLIGGEVSNEGEINADNVNLVAGNKVELNVNRQVAATSSVGNEKAVNKGTINTRTGGSVNIVAPVVANDGLILAHAGQVNMVAGEKVTVDFDGDGLMQFTIDKETLQNAHNLDSAVSNTGTINSGTVILKGSTAKDVFTNVVNNSGMIGASKIDNSGGKIRLVAAGSSNSLLNTGTLDASSNSGDGGTIDIYATGDINIAENSVIDASSYSNETGIETNIATGSINDTLTASGQVSSGTLTLTGGNSSIEVTSTTSGNSGTTNSSNDTSTEVGGIQSGGSITLNAGDTSSPSNSDSISISSSVTTTDMQSGGDVSISATEPVVTSETETISINGSTTVTDEQQDSNVQAISAMGGSINIASESNVTIEDNAVIKANSANGDAGSINISSADTTILKTNSLISATSNINKGGYIEITGDKVGLIGNTTIDASGKTGGGEILIGGDYQGNNLDVQNASVTYVDEEVTINADAYSDGDAGKVILWADDTTRFYGDISATGGSQSGNGGFVEVSGKEHLTFEGGVDVSAPMGEAGSLLLDPGVLNIVETGAGSLDAGSCTGTCSILFATGGATESVSLAAIEAIAAGTVTLQAQQTINVEDLDATTGDGSIDLMNNVSLVMQTRNQAGDGQGSINFADTTNSIIASGTGSITIESGTDGADGGSLNTIGNLQTDSGTILLRAASAVADTAGVGGGDIDIDGTITTTNGNLVVQASGNVVIDGVVDTNGGSIHLEANSRGVGGNGAGGVDDDTTAGSELTINAAVNSDNGAITLIGEDDTIAATVNAGSGTINIAELGGGATPLNSNFSLGNANDLTNTELDFLQTTGRLEIGVATTAGTDGLGTGAETVLATDVSIESNITIAAATAGTVSFNGQGAAAGSGSINANAGFTIVDTFTLTAATNQNILINADNQDGAGGTNGVGTVSTGVTGTGTLTMDGGDLEIIAGSGIGTTAIPFVTTGVTDLAARTVTGDLAITNTGSVINVTSLDLDATDGVAATNGLSITGDGGTIQLTNNNNITLSDDINAGADDNVTLSTTGTVSQTAGNDITANLLTFQSSGTYNLTNNTNNVVDVTATGTSNIDYHDADALNIAAAGIAATSVSLTAVGALTDSNATTIAVTGLASFTGSSILIGDNGGDTTNFGSLTFNSASGSVTITEDSDTTLAGSNTADSLVLTSAGAITDSAATSVNVDNGNATITGTSINLADNAADDYDVSGNANFNGGAGAITIAATGAVDFGSLTFNTTGGAVSITEDSATILNGSNTADSLTLTSAGAITDNATTTVNVDNGNAAFTGTSISLADNAGDDYDVSGNASFNGGAGAVTIAAAGAVDFGSLTFNTTGGAVSITEDSATVLDGTNTADSLTLTSAGAITDNATTTVNVDNGNAAFTGTSISLADNAGDDYDVLGNANFNGGAGAITIAAAGAVDFGSLTFNTTGGAVDITEDSATLLNGSNTADSLTLTSAGAITDNAVTTVNIDNGNANFTGTSIDIANTAGDDYDVSGNANFNGGAGDITINQVNPAAVDFGTLTFNTTGGTVNIFEDSDTQLAGANTANTLRLTSGGALTDAAGTTVNVDTFFAVFTGTSIDLADTGGDDYDVLGQARFEGGAGAITVGSAGATNFGTLRFNTTDGAVNITEDDGTTFEGSSTADSLVVTSAGAIASAGTASQINVDNGNADINGTSINLGNNAGDSFVVSSGTADFDGGAGGITIGATGTANFTSLRFNSTGAVDITEDSPTVLTGTNTANSLALTSAGSITDSTGAAQVTVTTTSVLDATAANDISLVNTGNNFQGNVTITNANNVTIDDANNISFGTVNTAGNLSIDNDGTVTFDGVTTVGGNLDVDANANNTNTGGLISDSGTGQLLITGTTTLSAGTANNIILDRTINDFDDGDTGDNVSVTDASTVTLVDRDLISLGAITATGGAITVTGTSIDVNGVLTTTGGAGGALSITGNVDVNASPSVGATNITLNGGAGSMTIDANIIDDAAISLSSDDDIIVSATVQTTGANNIILTADANNDGAGGVRIQTAGLVDSGQNVTLSGSDLIDGTAVVNAGIQIDADGTNNQINAAGTVTINHNGNTADATETIIDGRINAGGAVSITSQNDINFGADGDVISTTGGVTLLADNAAGTLGGVVSLTNGTVIDAGDGLIDIDADGSITIGQLTTTGNVNLTSTSGAVVDGGDTGGVDISAAALVIDADTGVGSADAIETTVTSVDIDNTTSGNVDINETNALDITKIAIAGGTGTVNVDAGGTITVTAAGTGITTQSGQIELDANGVASSIAVNDALTSNGGVVNVLADDDVSFAATGSIASTNGAVTVTADADGVGAASGALTMTDGATINAGNAAIALNADQDITLGQLTTSSNVTLTTTEGGIVDGGDAGVDVTANALIIDAVTGVGSAGEIETTVTSIDVDNTTSGNIIIAESDGVAVTQLDNDAANGAVTLTSAAGVINVNGVDGVSAASGGAISLDANGAGSDIVLNTANAITNSNADITLEANDRIVIQASAGIVSTGTGNVSITANADDLAGTNDLRMLSGTSINAGSGTITLSNSDGDASFTSGNIEVSTLTTTNATANAITITTDATVDNLIGAGSLITAATGAGGLVIDARTGVGVTNAINTNVTSIDLDNTTSGNVQISEANAITLTKVDNAGSGTTTSVVTTGTGDMQVVTVDAAAAGSTVTLQTNDGAITDDGVDSTLSSITADGGGSTINITAGGGADDDIGANSGGGTPPLNYLDINAAGTPSVNPVVTAGQDIFINFVSTVATDVRSSDFSGAKASLNTTDIIGIHVSNGQFIFDDTTFDSLTGSLLNIGANTNINFIAAGPEISAANDVILTAVTGAVTDNDATVDISADDLVIDAVTGVGDGNAIDTTVATLDIDNATSGNIQILETNGVTVNKIAQATAGNINLQSTTGTVTIATGQSGVTAAGAGTITILADGAASGDLIVNHTITSVNGDITLRADNDVTFSAAGDATSTAGNVSVTADFDNGGAASGALTMVDGTIINAGSGTISLSAAENISLGQITTTNNTTSSVSVTSTDGGIIDNGDSQVDIVSAGEVTLSAATGIGSANDIETSVVSLDITNTGSGAIDIDETDAITVIEIDQGANALTRITAGGTITVDDTNGSNDNTAIASTAGGSVTLDANGANSDIVLTDGISTAANGVITLTADDSVTAGVNGDILASGTGALIVTADANSTAGGDDGDVITMVDGTVFNAGTGISTLSASGNISLGSVSSGAVGSSITSTAGGIIDNGDTHIDIASTFGITISAVTGIGSTAGVGADADIETTVSAVNLTNTGSGRIDIDETNALTIIEIDQGANQLTQVVADGAITVIDATGSNDGTAIESTAGGSVLLDANGANSDIVLTDGISTTANGAITLTADDSITAGADGDITAAGTGALIVTADANTTAGGDGGDVITMLNGAVFNAGSGTAALSASGNISLGSVTTTNTSATSVTLTSTAAGIVDNGDTDVDVVSGGRLVIDAITGVGSAGALETTAESFDVDTTSSGNIDIDNNFTTGTVTVTNLNVAAGTGTINFDNIGDQALTINSATTNNGNITITNQGNLNTDTLTIAGAVSTANANTITISSLTRGDIAINNTITTGAGGTITVNSSDDITIGAFAVNSGTGIVNLNVDTNDNVAAVLDLGGSTITANDINLNGGVTTATADTLIGQNQANIWTLSSGNDDGTLENGGAGLSSTADFTNFHNLTGNAGSDLFDFNGGSVSGNVDGQDGTNTLDYAGAAAGSLTLNSTGGTTGFSGLAGGASQITGTFDNITNLVGSAATDTLTGMNAGATWTIQLGNDSYAVGANTLTFDATAVENLTGNANVDTYNITVNHDGNLNGGNGDNVFNFANTGAGTRLQGNVVTGTGADTFNFGTPTGTPPGTNRYTIVGSLNGGDGSDTLNYSGSVLNETITITGTGSTDGSQGTFTGNAGDAALVSAGFDNINNFTGNGTGTFTGPDSNTFWNITAANTGTYGGTLATIATNSFSNFDILAGSGNDVFIFQNGGVVGDGATTGIDGGDGVNTLAGSMGDDIFNILGNTTVNLVLGGNTTRLLRINNIDGTSAFTTTPGVQTDTGNDTFNINNNWTGNLAGVGGNDTFTFADGITVGGTIDGGAGDDIINWNAYTTARVVTISNSDGDGFDGTEASVNGGGANGFVNIDDVRGSTAVNTNSLTAEDTTNAWAITGADVGSITESGDALDFSEFEILNGGSGADTFTFSNGATVSTSIDGNGGADALDLSAYATARAVTINATSSANGFTGSEASVNGGTASSIRDIDTITLRAAAGDSLQGANFVNTWEVTGANSGTLEENGNTLNFSAVDSLTGGTTTDSFTLNGGTLTGSIAGGGGTNTLTGDNVVNNWVVTAADTGTLAGSISGFSDIQNLNGGSNTDTFTINSNLTGNITGGNGTNTYSLNAGGSVGGTIVGGTGNDTFDFNDGTVTGTINGGTAGTNTLDYTNLTAAATTTITGIGTNVGFQGTTTSTAGFDNITVLTGSGNTDTLNGQNAAADWTVNGGGTSYVSGGRTLTFSAMENLNGGSGADTFDITGAHTGNLTGGAGADSFTLNGGTITGSITGGADTDTLIGSNTYVVTGANAGTAAGVSAGWSQIENLSGTAGVDTFTMNVGSTLSGLMNGLGGADNSFFNGQTVTLNGTNTGISNIENVDMNNAGGVLVGTAGTSDWVLNAATGGTVDDQTTNVNFTGTQTIRSGSGANTYDANGAFNGTVNLTSNDNVWSHNNGQTLTNGNVTGTGSLTIPGSDALGAGNNLTIGAGGLILPTLNAGYTGHLIIGGLLTDPGATPFTSASAVEIRIETLTVDAAIDAGGAVTLLAGDINLNADITAGDTIGMIAAGLIVQNTLQGNITADPGGVSLNAPDAQIIASNDIINSTSITLNFGGGEVDVAKGNDGDLEFNGGSTFTDTVTDPDFESFVTLSGNGGIYTTPFIPGGGGNITGLTITQAFAINPASALIGLETLAFIDVGLFEEELQLYGVIGTGIALALAQCEEQEGCAPNITEDELNELIYSLKARITEIERRVLAADNSVDRNIMEALLIDFQKELFDFEGYLKELQEFFSAEEVDEEFEEDLGDEDGLLDEETSIGEVDRLAKVLATVKARIEWLESLKANPEERARLGKATGIELTQEALDAIIEGAKAEAGFIENQIKLLIEGTEAMLGGKPGSIFTAEAHDYNSIQTIHYGNDLLSLDDNSIKSLINVY
jgi:hypothetical protein